MGLLLLEHLKHRWGATVAVALMVAAVVAALVAHRSIVVSAEGKVHELAHKLGANLILLPEETDLTDFYGFRYGQATLPPDIRAVISSSEVAQQIGFISPRLYSTVEVGGREHVLIGEETAGDLRLEDGVFPAVLGVGAAASLDLKVGSELGLASVTLRVMQILDVAGGHLDDAIVTTLPAAQLITGRPGAVNAVHMGGCWCRTDIPTLASNVERIVPGSRALTAAGMIAAQKGVVTSVRASSGALYAASMFTVAAAIFAVAAAQVRRQRREIGLLHAIGAQPGLLALLYGSKSVLAGVTGGLAGFIAAGPLTAIVASSVLGIRVSPEPGLLLPVLAISIGLSAMAALPPAFRAVKLDPVEVLREV